MLSIKKPLHRTIAFYLGYLFFLWLSHLVMITLVTYTITRSHESLHRVDDFMRANQTLLFGFAALAFAVLMQMLHPLTKTKLSQVFHFASVRKFSAVQLLSGFVLAAVYLAGGLLTHHLSWLGIYMSFDEVAVSMVSMVVLSTALFFLITVEEYVLRQALEPELERHVSRRATLCISTVCFLGIKILQFDVAPLQLLNLALLNMNLSLIARNEKSHLASAIFSSAFLISVHAFFGLPLFGQDMPGIFLIRTSTEDSLNTLLSGGTAGPENGLVLTVLLVVFYFLPQVRSKKIEV